MTREACHKLNYFLAVENVGKFNLLAAFKAKTTLDFLCKRNRRHTSKSFQNRGFMQSS